MMFRAALGDGLELRLLDFRHAEALYRLTDKNREGLRRWLPWVDGARSPEDTKRFIRSGLEQFARDDGFQAGIWLAGKLVGVIGFHYFKWHSRRTEIGYWLDTGAQGRGVMTRACRRLCDYAFVDLALSRVEIHCDADNASSRKVAERLGFTQEGVLRGVGYNAGGHANEVIYGLLADEWPATMTKRMTI
jgi:ribosomal-protein-serine acetyltransferase